MINHDIHIRVIIPVQRVYNYLDKTNQYQKEKKNEKAKKPGPAGD